MTFRCIFSLSIAREGEGRREGRNREKDGMGGKFNVTGLLYFKQGSKNWSTFHIVADIIAYDDSRAGGPGQHANIWIRVSCVCWLFPGVLTVAVTCKCRGLGCFESLPFY